MCALIKCNTKNYLSIFFMIMIIQLFQNFLFAQTKTIYTPEGYPFTGYLYDEFSDPQIARLNYICDSIIIADELNAVRISDASNR